MGKSSISKQLAPLQERTPSKYWSLLEPFLASYEEIIHKKQLNFAFYATLLSTYGKLIAAQIEKPYTFTPFHRAIRAPIDYYQLGLDLFEPLIDLPHSTLSGVENLRQIDAQIKAGENVILYANHQIEADPQAISLMIRKQFNTLAQEMIFVAGERVVTDPLAVPLSLGRNLFCIYSKKYFDAHGERKVEMLEHNKKVMLLLGHHLNQGSQCIYIAPSGGRDRPNQHGVVEVAPFDPQSTELLYLLGKKAKKPTHFYPLALKTHAVLPPPEGLQIALGETRSTNEAPIHLYFGKEINMEFFPESVTKDKNEKKEARAEAIWRLVCHLYETFPS